MYMFFRGLIGLTFDLFVSWAMGSILHGMKLRIVVFLARFDVQIFMLSLRWIARLGMGYYLCIPVLHK